MEYTFPPVPTLYDPKRSTFFSITGSRSSLFYSILSFCSYDPPTSQRAWYRDLGVDEILPYFRLLGRLKLPPWYISFQFKVLHRLTPTGRYLSIRRIVPSDSCSFCEEQPDTILHYFYYCEYARHIWAELETKLHAIGINVFISLETAILGSLDCSLMLNVIFLWTRVYIYKSKIANIVPTFPGLIGTITSYYNVLMMISMKTNNFELFKIQWSNLLPLFHSS